MTTFSVWAPNAQKVEVCLSLSQGMRRFEMEADTGGWFYADVEPTPSGTRYGFSLDGSKPLPDPRSPSQPDGVHGLSQLIDHDNYVWHDKHWRGPVLAASIIYELHIGTFTPEGTFDSAITRLDHLVELGVTTVELLPVAEAPGTRGWGYDGVSLYAPHSAYGGPMGLKRFVDACHQRGLAVFLDVVYNHLGPDGNYLGSYGPYFTDAHQTLWGAAVNYDGRGSDEVRRFALDNALMWMKNYHFDGLRLDAIHAVYDESAVPLFEEMTAEVERLAVTQGRPLHLIAESDLNDAKVVRARSAYGWGLDAQWSDDFHHGVHAALTGEQNGYYQDFGGLEPVVEALADTFVYVGQYSKSRDKSHGRPVHDVSAWHFLGYIQNHDQVGNRAVGERISSLVSPGRAKAGAALVVMAPFVPLLFHGEEWAASTPFQYFTDHEEKLGNLVREGRRAEFRQFGWSDEEVPDPQASSTFEASKLNWEEISKPFHSEMLEWYKSLIQLRKNEAALNDGGADLEAWSQSDVLSLRRGDIRLLVNLGVEPIEADDLEAQLLLASQAEVTLEGSYLVLPPDSVAILREG